MAGKDTPKKAAGSTRNSSPTEDAGQAEVQARFDEEQEKGYRGFAPDPTPNENYSLETGPDAPTPETDPELSREARAASGVGMSALDAAARSREAVKAAGESSTVSVRRLSDGASVEMSRKVFDSVHRGHGVFEETKSRGGEK